MTGRMRKRHYKIAACAAVAVGSTIAVVACTPATANASRAAVVQASKDHACPRRQIRIEEEYPLIWAYRLRVCGKTRKYRDRGGSYSWEFVDVTDDVRATPKQARDRANERAIEEMRKQ